MSTLAVVLLFLWWLFVDPIIKFIKEIRRQKKYGGYINGSNQPRQFHLFLAYVVHGSDVDGKDIWPIGTQYSRYLMAKEQLAKEGFVWVDKFNIFPPSDKYVQ